MISRVEFLFPIISYHYKELPGKVSTSKCLNLEQAAENVLVGIGQLRTKTWTVPFGEKSKSLSVSYPRSKLQLVDDVPDFAGVTAVPNAIRNLTVYAVLLRDTNRARAGEKAMNSFIRKQTFFPQKQT